MNDRDIYLVLGASSDVGAALLNKLNEGRKDSIFICHYRSNKKEIEKINPVNNNIFVYRQADFSNLSEVQNFIDEIKENYDAPTYMIHLQAGQFYHTKLKKFRREQLLYEIEIEICAFIEILQTFLPFMTKKKRKGKIVFPTFLDSTLALPVSHSPALSCSFQEQYHYPSDSYGCSSAQFLLYFMELFQYILSFAKDFVNRIFKLTVKSSQLPLRFTGKPALLSGNRRRQKKPAALYVQRVFCVIHPSCICVCRKSIRMHDSYSYL